MSASTFAPFGTLGTCRTVYAGSLDSLVRETYPHGEARRIRTYDPIGDDWVGLPAGIRREELAALPFRPDPGALQTIDGMRRDIQGSIPAPRDRRRRPRWSEDSGDDVCLDRLRSGQSPWREVARVNASGPAHVTILAQIGAPGSVDASNLPWAPAASLALTDLLEGAGYRVRLLMGWASHDAFPGGTGLPRDWIGIFQVKGFADPLNLQALSVTAAPWFFRHHLLAVKDAVGITTDGYGRVRPITRDEAQTVAGEPDGASIHVIPRQARYSREEAVSLVRAALRGIFPKTETPMLAGE